MKNIIIFILLSLFINNALADFKISYIYNSDDYVDVYLNDSSITTASIFVNGLDITSYCSFYTSGFFYKCSNLPLVPQIISGYFKATYNGESSPDLSFYFSPQLKQIVYPSGTRLPTTGGIVTLNGRYFDKLTYTNAPNQLKLIYRRQEITDYTLVNRSQIIVNIPEGTGGSGTGRLDNPIYLSCIGNASLLIQIISYNYPEIEKRVGFDENTRSMVVRGTDFGNNPELIEIFACDIKLSNVQLVTPHTEISAVYDVNIFKNRSCSYILVGINGLNSTIENYGVLVLPPKIISVSTPPVQGGKIEIVGDYLGNLFMGNTDLNWRININGVEYPSSECSSIATWILVCNSPGGTFGTSLPVQIKVSSYQVLSNTFNAPYSEQTISGTSRLYYTQGGVVTINGANFFSDNLAVAIGGVACTSAKYININTISCYFSANVVPNINGLSISINSINGFAQIANAFQYLPSPFTDIVQVGGSDNLQLVGNYFSPDMSVVIGSQDISSYCKTDSLTSISCLGIPNIPSGDVVITGGDSSRFSSFVLTPSLYQASNTQIPSIGSTITLSGKFFELKVNNEPSQTLSILINGTQEYTSLNLIDSSNIQFTMPPSQEGQVGSISIKSKDKVSNSISFVYKDYVKVQSVTQVGQGIKIGGYGFKLSVDNLIQLGKMDITSSCTINSDSEIVCQVLPQDVESGYLKVSSSSGASNYLFYLTPVITSISKSVLDSSGEEISVIGRFFEQNDPTNENINSINVYIDSNPNPMPTIVLSGTLIVTSIDKGFGAIHKLYVNTENRLSNSISYSYVPPVLNDFYQIGEEFHINADHFSRDNLALNKIYINNMPAITSLKASDTDYNELIFSIPSVAQNGILVLEVDGQKSNSIDIYLKPIIKSLSPIKPYIDGSIEVTVNGLYFSNVNYKANGIVQLDYSYTLESDSTNTVNKLDCTYLNGYSVKCSNFKGYGNGSLVISKIDAADSKVSNPFGFTFQSPKVIKSTSLYYQQGSNITITAESFSSNSLKVLVEDVECLNPVALDNRHIQCFYDATVPPKKDDRALNITITSNSMIGTNSVFYYYEALKCENNCTSPSNGQCNPINGACICTESYQGIDCSIEKQPQLPPPELNEKGESNIIGTKLNFTVSIVYLREIDINGLDVKVLDMKSIQWVNSSNDGNNKSYFKGTFKNDPAIVELDVTYYKDSLDYDFAGDIVQISNNSIKYVITVSNWQFESRLNTFQLVYNAQTLKNVNTGCKLIETNSTESSIQDQSVSWFQITAGSSILNGKFARRIFADDAVKKSSISILTLNDSLYKLINESSSSSSYNKLTAINTPYFDNSVVLDPTFNSLLRPSDNDDSCSKSKWKIPVIASLCAVGGAAILVGASFTIYKIKKQRRFESKIKSLSSTSNK